MGEKNEIKFYCEARSCHDGAFASDTDLEMVGRLPASGVRVPVNAICRIVHTAAVIHEATRHRIVQIREES